MNQDYSVIYECHCTPNLKENYPIYADTWTGQGCYIEYRHTKKKLGSSITKIIHCPRCKALIEQNTTTFTPPKSNLCIIL